MTFDELTLQLMLRMVETGGPLVWTDSVARQQISAAAIEMATAILGIEVDDDEVHEMTTQAVYIKHGTAITFGSEAGNVNWSTENIDNGAGRQSDMHDQGDPGTPRPLLWEYRIYTQAKATPTIGNRLNVYLKTSDGTHPDNDDGAGDAAVSSINKLLNLTLLRSPVVDEAAANIEFVSRGVIEIPFRYFGLVLWNAMGSAVTNDAAETKAVFTPIYEDVQAAA